MTANTKRCLCQAFSFGTYGPDGSAESYTDYGTGCKQTTTRVFAQGHDAKLIGFMVRAELSGEEINMDQGGVRHTLSGAVSAAATVSEALATKAEAQLDAAKARVAKTAAREATKKARQSAKAANQTTDRPKPTAPTFKPIACRAKVGRWTYDGTELQDGSFRYDVKFGGVRIAKAGSWTKEN